MVLFPAMLNKYRGLRSVIAQPAVAALGAQVPTGPRQIEEVASMLDTLYHELTRCHLKYRTTT